MGSCAPSNNPACIDSGVAYGAYQMDTYNTNKFVVWLSGESDKTRAEWGASLAKAYKADSNACGKNFNAQWKAIAAKSSDAFFVAQYEYCFENYYKPARKLWMQVAPGFDTAYYTYALRNVLFSTAIQHGPYGSAYYIFEKALNSLGGWKGVIDEEKLIDAIYYERSRVTKTKPEAGAILMTKKACSASDYERAKKHGIQDTCLAHFYLCSPNIQLGVYERLHNNERADAQAMREELQGAACKHEKTTGGVVTWSNATDTTHVEKRTALVCSICKEVVTPASTQTVKNSYVMAGNKYYEKVTKATGVVHSASRYYQVKADVLNLRSKASTSGKVVTTVSQGTMLKPSKVVVGADGYYWGLVKVGGKSGYLRMNYLTPHGTASKHVYSNGKCKYCGYSKARLTVKKAGTYKLRCKAALRKAAYKSATALKVCNKGTKVKVVKVVKNINNDYWVLLQNGTYTKMTSLY